jgi:hypothetical protein
MIWQKQYVVVPLKGDNAVLQGGAALRCTHGQWTHKKAKERAARKAKNKYAFVTIFSVIILIKRTLVHQHGVVLFSPVSTASLPHPVRSTPLCGQRWRLPPPQASLPVIYLFAIELENPPETRVCMLSLVFLASARVSVAAS